MIAPLSKNWRTLDDIPEEYRPYFISGENWCCDGGELNGNPWPPFTKRHRAFRAGWIRQDREIRQHGRIL